MSRDEAYYSDKTSTSQSMLSDFVSYGKYGTRFITPELYYAKHIANALPNPSSDAMLKGTIVDRVVSEGEHVLMEYPVVSKRSGDNKNEITNKMIDEISSMLSTIDSFKTLKDIIKKPGTIKGDGECTFRREIVLPNGTMMLKGKTDFVNHDEKFIVDLKTTASVDKVFDDLQFRGTPNVFARYVRQGAFYRYLLGQEYAFAIAVVDDDMRMAFIPVRPEILDASWNHIYEDLTSLQEFYKNGWGNLIVDPFGPLKEISETDDL